MTHSPEQMRKKAEALAESEHHARHNVVGDEARDSEQTNQLREDDDTYGHFGTESQNPSSAMRMGKAMFKKGNIF